MSLMDALLLDPEPLDVWVALRTDGAIGSGTEDDPYDGSVTATPVIAVTSITSSGQTATVTAPNHGFQVNQLVQISGVSGPMQSDAAYYNGTFYVTSVTTNTFTYTMAGTPTGSATGSITCQLDPYRFDSVMRTIPIPIQSFGINGTTATVVAIQHGFQNGSFVLIEGAQGPNPQYYNGVFRIQANNLLGPDQFSYTMGGAPGGTPSGGFCRLFQFDAAARLFIPAPPLAVRLGPGLFQTKGYSPPALASWIPRSGMNLFGSGRQVSVYS